MSNLMIGVGLVVTASVAFPATSSAEFSYGLANLLGKDLTLSFNDGNACGLHVTVSRSGSTARSNARYYCYNTKTKQALANPIKVKMVNTAGEWLNIPEKGTEGRQYKTCESHECHAPEATFHGLSSGGWATGTAAFHIYYHRNAAFFFTPPGCEYVEDPEGKGPPGYRITCAIQARTK